MNERIRYHLDEHVDPDIARALHRYGIDVTTTLEARLRTEGDEAHIAYVRETGRVVVTSDTDFLRFAAENADHPGIAYFDQTARSVRDVVRGLILVYEVLSPEEMRGRVEFL